jgi:hypothetical protein
MHPHVRRCRSRSVVGLSQTCGTDRQSDRPSEIVIGHRLRQAREHPGARRIPFPDTTTPKTGIGAQPCVAPQVLRPRADRRASAEPGATHRQKRGPVRLSTNRAKNLATTYSRGTYRPTTIGCSGLNGRVRDGNGWNPRHMVTRKGSPDEVGAIEENSDGSVPFV